MTDPIRGRCAALAAATARTLALAAFAAVLAGPATAQETLDSARDTAAATCRTGIGDLEGILEASEDAAASDRQEARRLIDEAKAAASRGEYPRCFDLLERALVLLDGPSSVEDL